jgi:hypothetical protein
MCVHLNILFTFKTQNIVVALGDMAFRWTNLTEPWMPHIYALLRDSDVHVRYNALTVLTHLVLNDMVKVRGQVCMVVCVYVCMYTHVVIHGVDMSSRTSMNARM